MSSEASSTSLSEKVKKRPCVSSKCILNIKSIVSQNLPKNVNNKNSNHRLSGSMPPPLPLINTSIVTKDSIKVIDDTKDIPERNGKKLQVVPTANILINSTSYPDLKTVSDREIIETNGHDEAKLEIIQSKSTSIELLQTSIHEKEAEILTMNKKDASKIPPLPLNSSVYSFGSTASINFAKPLLSFPTESSNQVNEEYLANMRQIIESIPIHSFNSTSPSVSTFDDDNDDNLNLNGSAVIVNSTINLPVERLSSPVNSDQNVKVKSRLSEPAAKDFLNNRKTTTRNYDQYYVPNSHGPTNYTRLPHALRNASPTFSHPNQSNTVRSLINSNPIRRQYPQFESVRTPINKPLSIMKTESPRSMPSELFNCCQTQTMSFTTQIIKTQRNSFPRNSQRELTTIEANLNESDARASYLRDNVKIREIMLDASKRLTSDNALVSNIPVVDTHCHFDLIFDRLHIKHNDLKQYFKDYSQYYPPGLSFQLAIQVFWRPKQLTEDNWTYWFSKYLDDERVYGACGIHPHWSSEWNEKSVEDIERCLKHPKVVAIGEIGLDFGPKNACSPIEQRRSFEAQLKLAAKWLKPIVIHSRSAYAETFHLMRQYLQSNHKIHLHCFVGTIDDVNLFTSYFTEIKFGFTPIITRYDFLHETIQQLDLTQILSETDSPYFVPDELSSLSRCAHPGMVYSVIEMIAKIRHLPVMHVACQLRQNARHIYGV